MFTFFFAISLIMESGDEQLLPWRAPVRAASWAGAWVKRFRVWEMLSNFSLIYFLLMTCEIYIAIVTAQNVDWGNEQDV